MKDSVESESIIAGSSRGEGAHGAVPPQPTALRLGSGGRSQPFILPRTRRKRGGWARGTEEGENPRLLPQTARIREDPPTFRSSDASESISLRLRVSSCVQRNKLFLSKYWCGEVPQQWNESELYLRSHRHRNFRWSAAAFVAVVSRSSDGKLVADPPPVHPWNR